MTVVTEFGKLGQRWYRNGIQNKLTGGQNIGNTKWRDKWVCNKLTGHSIESVGQAVCVRSRGADKSRVQSARQRAGHRRQWDADAGVQFSTAGKSVVWDEGRRLLVSKDTEGNPMTIESRQADVRRLLMAVNPMTQRGHWSVLDLSVLYEISRLELSFFVSGRCFFSDGW